MFSTDLIFHGQKIFVTAALKKKRDKIAKSSKNKN